MLREWVKRYRLLYTIEHTYIRSLLWDGRYLPRDTTSDEALHNFESSTACPFDIKLIDLLTVRIVKIVAYLLYAYGAF